MKHGSHADPGTAFGTGEALFYRRAVQNSVELPAEMSSCADYITGTIMGQAVVVTTSGMFLITIPSNFQFARLHAGQSLHSDDTTPGGTGMVTDSKEFRQEASMILPPIQGAILQQARYERRRRCIAPCREPENLAPPPLQASILWQLHSAHRRCCSAHCRSDPSSMWARLAGHLRQVLPTMQLPEP
jgi:hypothetical protein